MSKKKTLNKGTKLYAIPCDKTNIVDSEGNMLCQEWEVEFDEKWQDPMEKKHGKGFALYCSFCNGEWKEEIKSFISQKLTEQKEAIIKWADENMADGDLTYERLLMFIKKL
jgi:hypothetical protein